MCELLGICFSRPIIADFTMREFSMRDEENADGWGLGWYRGESLAVAKEPLTWRQSRYADFLANYPHLRSHLYIGHVRRRTVGGEPKRADTHPFSRELGGREYCFAHNGTVRDAMSSLALGRFTPIGDTDSEHVLCHLLAQLERRSDHLEHEDDWQWLHEQFIRINRLGKFNCVLADGQRMFCYHDANGFKGLCLSEMTLPLRESEELDDSTMHVDLETDGALNGVVVATRPLNDNGWRLFEHGELVVLQGGAVIHSSPLPAHAAS